MKTRLSLALLLFFPLFVFSQNLLENGDVEEIDGCPEGYNRGNAYREITTGWNHPTEGDPDLLHRCNRGEGANNVGVPFNFAGNMEAASGDAYLGAFMRGLNGNREYIMAELSHTLKKGETYCVSFKYALSAKSYYAIQDLGMLFSEQPIYTRGRRCLPFAPQIVTPKGKYLENKTEWSEMCTLYEAKGGERFVIIGCFVENHLMQLKPTLGVEPPKTFAYYYFDDISVASLTNCKECSCVPQGLAVKVENQKFTGGTDGSLRDGAIEISVAEGTPPYNITWSTGSTAKKLENLPAGDYVYRVTDAYHCIQTDTISFIAPLRVTSDWAYTGGTDGYINLTTTGGRRPYEFTWNTGAIDSSLQNLPEGIYSYVVKDASGQMHTDTFRFIAPLQVEMESYYSYGYDGYIYLLIAGGLEPYIIEWADGAEEQNRSELGPGRYVYKVTDDGGTMKTDSVRFVAPLEAQVESGFTGEDDGYIKLIPMGGVAPYTLSWDNGSVSYSQDGLSAGVYNYTLRDNRDSMVQGDVVFKALPPDPFADELKQIKEGEPLVLNNILFESNKAKLVPSSYLALNQIADFIRKFDVKEIEISGHTDSQGPDAYNQKLSEARAKSVVDYLLLQGIDNERLTFIGYGESKPKASNSTSEGRSLNRRVEFLIKRK